MTKQPVFGKSALRLPQIRVPDRKTIRGCDIVRFFCRWSQRFVVEGLTDLVALTNVELKSQHTCPAQYRELYLDNVRWLKGWKT